MTIDVRAVFDGSDGDATKALYAELEQVGPSGVVALNVFRAKKNSDRAKVYRGGAAGRGSYRRLAYERKNWAMSNLADVLQEHGTALCLRWGWKEDPAQAFHCWVLYVDLPTGQVSFHTAGRGCGPDYPGEWDRIEDVIADRICSWVEQLLVHPPDYVPAHERGGTWCVHCRVEWPHRNRCPVHHHFLAPRPGTPVLPEIRSGVRAQWDDASRERQGRP